MTCTRIIGFFTKMGRISQTSPLNRIILSRPWTVGPDRSSQKKIKLYNLYDFAIFSVVYYSTSITSGTLHISRVSMEAPSHTEKTPLFRNTLAQILCKLWRTPFVTPNRGGVLHRNHADVLTCIFELTVTAKKSFKGIWPQRFQYLISVSLVPWRDPRDSLVCSNFCAYCAPLEFLNPP